MMGWEDAPQPLVLACALVFLLVSACWHRYYPLPDDESSASEQRAAELLREILAEDEHRQLADLGYLTVSSPGVEGRVYRVPGKPGWVEVREGGRLAMRLCVQPVQHLPDSDVVLMHKLMIEGNEDEYLRKANMKPSIPVPQSRQFGRQRIRAASGAPARPGTP